MIVFVSIHPRLSSDETVVSIFSNFVAATFRRLSMQASRIKGEEALRIGFIEALVNGDEELNANVDGIIAEVMTTGPSAVSLSKELTLGFDRWTESDMALREWTLDFTSRMRGSNEGQEGLSSFLEKRPANWKPQDE